MCLAVPARIISRNADSAVVDLHGNRLSISVLLTPDAQIGDHVLLHAGFAIQRLEPLDAHQTLALLDALDTGATRFSESGSPPPLSPKGGRP